MNQPAASEPADSVRPGVINDDQQTEAGQEREVSLIFEPVQLGRHPLGGDRVFLRQIEAAAVDHPALAGDAGSLTIALPEARLQPDEEEGGADP
jgi:hypothetical protein